MSDRLKMPPASDFGFYQRRKHDKWREVPTPAPAIEAPVADSHAHIHMLPDPAWELARCAANGVDYVCMIVDPSEDGSRPFDSLRDWEIDAEAPTLATPEEAGRFAKADAARGCTAGAPGTWLGAQDRGFVCPTVRIAAGVHPHNAKLYSDAVESELVGRLADERVVALGEIGLDFHYDLSPRDVQRRVFCRQVELAKRASLPIVLHLRGGDDPVADNAHAQAFDLLRDMDALGPGTLLHCCTLSPDELRPWVEADCYIAYGGAITFKNADAAREGARLVPANRLLLETDSPYMTPEPMRGATCTPAHVVFTAAALADMRGIAAGDSRRGFLRQLHDNTQAFYARGECAVPAAL